MTNSTIDTISNIKGKIEDAYTAGKITNSIYEGYSRVIDACDAYAKDQTKENADAVEQAVRENGQSAMDTLSDIASFIPGVYGDVTEGITKNIPVDRITQDANKGLHYAFEKYNEAQYGKDYLAPSTWCGDSQSILDDALTPPPPLNQLRAGTPLF